MKTIGLKIDVDTLKGAKVGVPNLARLLNKLGCGATFFLSLGPDNTGRALRRAWRPSFILKCLKTKVASNYSFSTLLNGVLWPGPHIGGHCESLLRPLAYQENIELGIHSYDHQRWQNGVNNGMSAAAVQQEFARASAEFKRIFDKDAKFAAAPGWQANAKTLAAYAAANIKYASDARGHAPFYPIASGKPFNILQLPTTMPTLDELLGFDGFSADFDLIKHLTKIAQQQEFSVFTLHAELEGMKYLEWFSDLLSYWKALGWNMVTLGSLAKTYEASAPNANLVQGAFRHRSEKLALQENSV